MRRGGNAHNLKWLWQQDIDIDHTLNSAHDNAGVGGNAHCFAERYRSTDGNGFAALVAKNILNVGRDFV